MNGLRSPIGVGICALALAGAAGAVELPQKVSEETRACVECHKDSSPALYQQWGLSKHYRADVGCFECHGAGTTDSNALDHYGYRIHVIVTPRDCGRCHSREVDELLASDNHRWFIGKQTAAEKAERAAEREHFKARYTGAVKKK